MARPESDRNLLFGVLALQMDFITRDALIAAMNAWALEKTRSLGHILIERGDLHPDDFALLDPLVAKHVERHGNDPERSLESLSSVRWLRQGLQPIADPELDAGVARLGADKAADPDPWATLAHSIGDLTSTAQRFRILRPHASGGLGEVFVARDAELNREVALKQIKDDFADHPESRSRFLLEAEVTGGLEHPGIVPVYGLGHYADGRPFYAMRFIRGDSLKEAIDRFHRDDRPLGRDPGERALALRQLLRRYVDVCNAVAYAHSRGVLHRDLKPGNVMLGPYGETLVVDWGLAKPMGRREGAVETAESTLRPSSGSGLTPTRMGSAIGTPAYMSPEQASGRLDALGPASDVYSLGAMLYSLLTGQSPFREPEVGDVLRKVQSGDFQPPRQIGRAVPPALEAVCLKAMSKAPGSRYPSPRALADEIERWLADEPVSAWREPLAMRARRWMRRHRTLMSGATAAVLAGVVGLGAVVAVQDRSNRALRKSQEETKDALAQSEEARRRAEAVLGFLEEDVLAAARPEVEEGGLGIDVTVRKAIDAAEPRIQKAFHDQPVSEAGVRNALGQTYHYMGELSPAIRQLERAVELGRANLAPEDPKTLASCNNLAMAYLDAGRTDDAIALQRATLEIREKTLGLDHPSTLRGRNNLAIAYGKAGRTADAIRLHEEALRLREAKLGPDHYDTLESRGGLAVAYEQAGRLADAIRLNEETLRLMDRKLGASHSNTLIVRNNLAVSYVRAGRRLEAIPLLEDVLKLKERKIGPSHPGTLATRNNLAETYRAVSRIDEAIGIHQRTLRLMEPKLRPDHPMRLTIRYNLGLAYESAGRPADAIVEWEAMVPGARSVFGPSHPNTVIVLEKLASAYESLGRLSVAEPLRREVLVGRRKGENPDDRILASDLVALGYNFLRQAKWSEAEAMLRECLVIRERAMPDIWLRFNTMSQLGGALLGQGRFSEAEPLIIGGYEGMKARQSGIPPAGGSRLLEAAERVIRLYEAWGQSDKATEWKIKLGLVDLPVDVFAPP